jgi:hypothetical protein
MAIGSGQAAVTNEQGSYQLTRLVPGKPGLNVEF